MIDALNDFLAVAAAGSFSQVAKTQAVAVSSVTRKIDWLEAEIGSRLFHRSPRRVSLTDAGEQFMPRARNILAELAEAKDSLAALNADPRGLMTITAPATFGRLVVAPAIASFLARYPLMEVELHVSDRFVDLAEQRVDVAVRIGALPDSDLLATRLAPMRLVACASPAYLARRGHPSTPDDLLAHDCIDVATGAAPGATWCFEGWNRNTPYAVRGRLRVNDKDCMREAALAGAGIVHIASWLVSDDIAAGRLVQLFPDTPSPYAKGVERAIHAVRMRGRSSDAKARLFIAHLREVFGDVPYWDLALDAARAERAAA
jgi:DNA-binding transcriptional LysR family regulator